MTAVFHQRPLVDHWSRAWTSICSNICSLVLCAKDSLTRWPEDGREPVNMSGGLVKVCTRKRLKSKRSVTVIYNKADIAMWFVQRATIDCFAVRKMVLHEPPKLLPKRSHCTHHSAISLYNIIHKTTTVTQYSDTLHSTTNVTHMDTI